MKMFFLGILVWSLICTVVYCIEALDDFDVAVFCAGPVFWVVALVVKGGKAIGKVIRSLIYRGLLQDPDGNIFRFVPYKEFTTLWDWADGWKPAHIEGYEDRSARFYPHKVWKNYPKVPDEVFQKAKENEELRKDEW